MKEIGAIFKTTKQVFSNSTLENVDGLKENIFKTNE